MRRLLLLAAALAAGAPAAAQVPHDAGDWPTYGGDAEGRRYSPLDRIDRESVGRLRVAWTWQTGETTITGPASPLKEQDVRPGNFEVTPVEVGDTLYLSTPYNRVVALDAGTGREIWSHDPRAWQWGQPPNGTGFVHRGVALWEGEDGERRVCPPGRYMTCYNRTSYNTPMTDPSDRGALRRNWFHVLVALADEELHGAAIARDVLEQTGGDLRLWPATLYRTLDEMADAGLIAELDEGERPHHASSRLRYHRTTPQGRAELRAHLERMESVLGTARRRLGRASS